MEFLKSLWITIYPVLCVFLPCSMYLILKSKSIKNKMMPTKSYYIWRFLFVLYIYMALKVAGSGSIWEIGQYSSLIRMEEINLIPFQSEGYLTYILNIIMFMPLGFLLPSIWYNYRTMYKTILTGLGFSFAIELGQLFNLRATDIDDLLMNTVGTAIGFLIWFIFSKLFCLKSKGSNYAESKEPIVYIALGFLGTFMLYNEMFFLRLFYAVSLLN